MCYTKATTLYISYLLLTKNPTGLVCTDKIQARSPGRDCHEHHGKEQTPIPPFNTWAVCTQASTGDISRPIADMYSPPSLSFCPLANSIQRSTLNSAVTKQSQRLCNSFRCSYNHWLCNMCSIGSSAKCFICQYRHYGLTSYQSKIHFSAQTITYIVS